MHNKFLPRLWRSSLLVILLVKAQNVYSQADKTLSGPIPNTQNITATHSITLDVGFSADGANGVVTLSIVGAPVQNCVPLNATPSGNQNYVMTLTPRQPFTDASTLTSKTTCQVMQSIQYVDGLGRPLQTVQVKGNPDATGDVIMPVAYDQYGREATKYLPYTTAAGTPGSYRADALTPGNGVFSFYNPTGTGASGMQQGNGMVTIPIPSATTGFEASPLNRVIEQGAPGVDWQLGGHTVKVEYATNDATDHWARFYTVSIDPSGARILNDHGNAGFDLSQLYITISKDENWLIGQTYPKDHTTEEYKDAEGHVVLKRTFNGAEALSTYYVYDDFGNLCFVLPPKAEADGGGISQAILDDLCYQYRYDERQRLVEKKIPGSGWQYVVYNKQDQVVGTQDANQRAHNQWIITKYDDLERTVLTGTWTNSNGVTDRVTLKGLIDGQASPWQVKDLNASGNVQGYYLSGDPLVLDQVLSVNYYDDYNFLIVNPVYPYVQNTDIPDMPITASAMTTGLLTASKVNVVGTSDMLWTVSYYDDKGRNIQSNMQHYLGGALDPNNHDEVSTGYDFTNAITQTVRKHYASGASTLNIANSFVYDHMGRKRQTWSNIDNASSPTLLSQIDYNEVGQALSKHLHSENDGASYLQNIAYSYNERGWLTNSTTDGNLFNESLNYNTPGTGILPQWNGNISGMTYNVNRPTPTTKQFLYTYDPLNRLNIATSTANQLDETIAYDKMGNITSLTRGGTSAASLGYNYLDGNGNYSNQLASVTNNSAAYRTYAYDGNGNATSDGGSQTINYNILNLPQSVVQGGTTKATYTYEASGIKVRNTGSDGAWDYDNGIVYQTPIGSTTAAISFIQTEEGRATRNISDGTYHYEYTLKDHLGNTRVSFDKDPSAGSARVIQESEYYSFGLQHDLLHNDNRYLYNGKEIQTDLANQYDYGARFYDPVIARWTSVDPLAENNRRWTPYNYAVNNPIRYIDPDGRDTAQRNAAVREAGRWVAGNDNGKGNTYRLGAKGDDGPGSEIDCSGLISKVVVAGGEKDPNHGTSNGITNIDNNLPNVDPKDVVPGNVVTLSNDSHGGLITLVQRDKDGNFVNLQMTDSGGKPSSGTSGPRVSDLVKDGKVMYWGGRVVSYNKFDTKPDAPSSGGSTSSATTTTQTSTIGSLWNSFKKAVSTLMDAATH